MRRGRRGTRWPIARLDLVRHEWVHRCIVVDLPLFVLPPRPSTSSPAFGRPRLEVAFLFLELTVLAAATSIVNMCGKVPEYRGTGVHGYAHPGTCCARAGNPRSRPYEQEHGAPWASWAQLSSVVMALVCRLVMSMLKTGPAAAGVCVCSPSPVPYPVDRPYIYMWVRCPRQISL